MRCSSRVPTEATEGGYGGFHLAGPKEQGAQAVATCLQCCPVPSASEESGLWGQRPCLASQLWALLSS